MYPGTPYLSSVLKKIRKARSLTQSEFSSIINKSSRELSFLETGRRPFSLDRANEYLKTISRVSMPLTVNEWKSVFKAFIMELVHRVRGSLGLDATDNCLIVDNDEEIVYEVPMPDRSCLKVSISTIPKEKYERIIHGRRRTNLDILQRMPNHKLSEILQHANY